MGVGLYIKGGACLGGDFSAGGDGLPRLRSAIRSAAEAKAAGTAFGIDQDAVRAEQVSIEETDERKIRSVAGVRLEYMKEDYPEGAWLSYAADASEKGTALLLLAAQSFAVPPKSHVYPACAGLYALAFKAGEINPEGEALTLLFMPGTVMSLATIGEKIAFARSFPDNAQLEMNVKLSSQSVYFAKRRQFIKPFKIVAISAKAENAKRLEGIFGDGTPVRHIDISGHFQGQAADAKEQAGLALAYGVSLAPQIAQLAPWDLLNPPRGRWEKGRGLILRCAALLLLAPLLFFAAEGFADKILIKRVDEKAKSIEPLFERVSGVIGEAETMRAFASKAGRDLISPDICFELLSAMVQARPEGLRLSSIAGNPYGAVSINASAPSYAKAIEFIESLGKAKELESAELIYAKLAENGRVEFQAILKYKFPKDFAPARGSEGGER